MHSQVVEESLVRACFVEVAVKKVSDVFAIDYAVAGQLGDNETARAEYELLIPAIESAQGPQDDDLAVVLNNYANVLVRQREPGPQGLPLEIYCFTKTTAWADYENIQSDIFDHLLAIVPEFGLRVYQQPAGSDLASLSVSAQTRPLGDTT